MPFFRVSVFRSLSAFHHWAKQDYKLLVMDGRPDYPHSPGLAILKQSFHLFQVEIEEWLRIALKPKRSPFQKRIKCSLQINR